MKNKKVIFIIIFLIIAIFTIFSVNIYVKSKNLEKNNNNLKNNILNIEKDVFLNEIVPFKWDKAYTFQPYINKQEIENILGFKDKIIYTSVDENMTNLIFVKDNKIVANICDYPENIGYNINFYKGKDLYNIIEYKQNVKFKANKKDNINYLEIIN